VFDWNRVGLDGKPRELHIAQSLASIDFNDFEPKLVETKFAGNEVKIRSLVNDPLFNVEVLEMKSGASGNLKSRKLQIVADVRGKLEVRSSSTTVSLDAGQFCLVPACLERAEILAKSDAALLRVEAN
jgi:mannose-6-phosphate isomerase